MPVILGTAGHIDHGKTTLVKALTGIDCDRLAEEKKRGITIELGFAFMELPGGRTLGVVDVPGHERFVKNMVAGAAGVDFVVLVIAADEGVMPQTREHLEICTLLGGSPGRGGPHQGRHGGPGVAGPGHRKTCGPFWPPPSWPGPPCCRCPPTPARVWTPLRGELARLADEHVRVRRSDLPRLPIDRVFTMKGHGTVVTGTLLAGSLSVGQEGRALPRRSPHQGARAPGARQTGPDSQGRTAHRRQPARP